MYTTTLLLATANRHTRAHKASWEGITHDNNNISICLYSSRLGGNVHRPQKVTKSHVLLDELKHFGNEKLLASYNFKWFAASVTNLCEGESFHKSNFYRALQSKR